MRLEVNLMNYLLETLSKAATSDKKGLNKWFEMIRWLSRKTPSLFENSALLDPTEIIMPFFKEVCKDLGPSFNFASDVNKDKRLKRIQIFAKSPLIRKLHLLMKNGNIQNYIPFPVHVIEDLRTSFGYRGKQIKFNGLIWGTVDYIESIGTWASKCTAQERLLYLFEVSKERLEAQLNFFKKAQPKWFGEKEVLIVMSLAIFKAVKNRLLMFEPLNKVSYNEAVDEKETYPILEELFETENKFFNTFNELVFKSERLIRENLRVKKASSLIKKSELKNIFKHIKKAVGMMTPFENKLKEMKCKTNFRLNELVELLSSHDFVCYARGLGQLSVLYRRLASKGILTKLVECASRIDTGKINTDIVKLWAQDPSSILIMPTQRIAKWPLFFKELLKKVEENPDHPLLDAVTVGHSLTRIAADHVNLMILLVDHNEDLTH